MKFNILKPLSVFVIVLALMQTAAYANGGDTTNSNISVSIENATLNTIFSRLENKTDYYFNYSEDIIMDTRTFSLDVHNVTIKTIMDVLAQKAMVHYDIIDKTVLVKKDKLQQQQVVISGKIVDAMGVPLMGASVVEKGKDNGVATNFDGEFNITVFSDDVILIASYVGFISKEVPISQKTTNLTIELEEDAQSLDQVVVTALGITREEKKIGYATQEVKLAAIEEVNAPNVGNLLTGQVAGLTVTNPTGLFQAPTFSLRGKTPLIVIDGIPVETNFFDITPSDIADINVLKGTTASALYGSRGRNGAVLITTKTATSEDIEITVSHNTLYTAGFTAFPKTQTEYGNGSNGKYEFWDGRDGGTSDGDMIWGPKFGTGIKLPQWNSPIYDNVTGETIPWWGDLVGTQYNDRSRYSRVPTPWEYHDNLNDYLEQGYVMTTDFSIAHKGEKGSFRISGMYSDQKSRIPNSSLKTGSLSFKSSTKLSDKLTLDSKLSYNKVYSPNYPRHGYGPRNHMYTILIWMGDDVNGHDLERHMYRPGDEGYIQANWNYAWYNNVYFATHELNQVHDANLINSQLKLNYSISDHLNFQVRGSAVIRDLYQDMQTPKSYMDYDRSRGDFQTWNSERLTVDYDALLTYDRKITEDIAFDINLGASSYYRKYQQEYNATDGLIVPNVYSLNNSQGNVRATTHTDKRATQSIYATLGVDLFDAVFLNLAGRNDWSSTLPLENRSYFYPSASISTVASNYIKLPDWFDFLKLYGSWAQVSSDLNPYQITSYYNNSGIYGSSPKLTYPSGIINPDIEPARSDSYELGTQLSFINGRIKAGVTYYNVQDSNQIIDLPISEASGFNSRKVNGNVYTTNGVEVVLGAIPFQSENFQWNTNVNWSRRVNRLTEIYDKQEGFGDLKLNDRADAFYANVWQKSPEGALILNNNGLPIHDNYKKNIGHHDPSWVFGLQNSFKYKNMSLDIGIDGSWGGLMRSLTVEKMWWGGKHPNSTEYRDAEYAAGKPVYVHPGVVVTGGELIQDVNGEIISDSRTFAPNTTAVSWQTWSQNYPYQAQVTEEESEKFANVFDRTFVKLRSVTFKYNITDILNIDSIKYADITLNGYNLLVLKKADIIDPDFGNDDNLQDPSSRYIGLGFNLKF